MNELEIPPAATRDENSVELIRAWLAEGANWISLNPHLFKNRDFEEEHAWGIFLADTTRHLSNALALESGKNQEETVKQIKKAFIEELEEGTSSVAGGFLG